MKVWYSPKKTVSNYLKEIVALYKGNHTVESHNGLPRAARGAIGLRNHSIIYIFTVLFIYNY